MFYIIFDIFRFFTKKCRRSANLRRRQADKKDLHVVNVAQVLKNFNYSLRSPVLLLIAEGLDKLFKIGLGQLQLPDLYRRLVLERGVSDRFKAVNVDLVAVDDSS